MRTATRCVRGEASPNFSEFGAISAPIYQTATFRQSNPSEFGEYDYTRTANPTRALVERQLASLEGGHYACVFASGMAAITALTRLPRAGDHIIAGNDLYGGTVRLLDQVLSRAGISVTYADTTDCKAVEVALRKRTRLVLVETPTNPLLQISDIRGLAQVAHSAEAILAVDNTMLSPCFQQPLALGADVVIHSATKFLCGHSDVTAGALITDDSQLYRQLAFQQNAEGAGLSPFESWLLLRGMKTLALRVTQQSASAHQIAHLLCESSEAFGIENVYYPSLPRHLGHQLHRSQATGDGAVISFTTGDPSLSEQLVSTLQLFDIAVSFGSVHSTISLPAKMSHASIPQSLRERMGPPPDLIRLSVGIEDVSDLIHDLTHAFNVVAESLRLNADLPLAHR